jgi:NDP-sugar pyrophosphorylase family protein
VKIEHSAGKRVGTASALGVATEFLGDRLVVYYGDVLTNMELQGMMQLTKKAICTLAMSMGLAAWTLTLSLTTEYWWLDIRKT